MILRRLDDNELGLWHEIEYRDSWVTLEEFLSRTENERRTATVTEPPQPRLATARGPTHPEAPPPPLNLPEAASSWPSPFPSVARIRPKRLKVFIAAGFLFGFVGAHNFYAGYRGTAVAQLLLAGVLYSLGFGLIVTWIWALIELLVVHTDPLGAPMT